MYVEDLNLFVKCSNDFLRLLNCLTIERYHHCRKSKVIQFYFILLILFGDANNELEYRNESVEHIVPTIYILNSEERHTNFSKLYVGTNSPHIEMKLSNTVSTRGLLK